jgi:hypothetical protein
MTIVATMLYAKGPTTPRRAVESVLPWVDWLLVLDSGIEKPQLAELRQLAGAKFQHVQFDWPKDFGAARNFAIEQAEQLGGTWAVTIDSDERLFLPGYAKQQDLLAAFVRQPTLSLRVVGAMSWGELCQGAVHSIADGVPLEGACSRVFWWSSAFAACGPAWCLLSGGRQIG